jgi:hypothetical protein
MVICAGARRPTLAPHLLPSGFMPRYPNEIEIDPARSPDIEDEDGAGRDRDPDDLNLEPERSVARHAEEAEEAELAEEDILEIADLEDELEARKGEGPDE